MSADEILSSKIDALADLVASLDPGRSLDAVQALRMIAQTAESAQRQAVRHARADGASWDEIGRALGTSRQAAHERYAPLTQADDAVERSAARLAEALRGAKRA